MLAWNILFMCFIDSLDRELDSLKDALLKARLDTTPPKTKSPGISLSKLLEKKKINKGQQIS